MSNRPSIQIDYPYKQLKKRGNLRIVTLQPGRRSDDVRCTLREESLEPRPQKNYEALSYSWGDSSDKHYTIWIDEKPQIVRENLYHALIDLRRTSRPRDLWVDFISINQSDMAERASQVDQMGLIYDHGDQVIVWVGKASDNSCLAIKFIKEIYAALTCDGIATDSGQYRYTMSKFIMKKKNRALWAAFAKFCNRPYWARRWIIQEIALASKCVIQCGSDVLDWEAFETVCLEIAKPNELWSTEMIPSRHSPAITCAVLRSLRRKTFDLQFLLEAFEHSVCKESHDKIYAILGLVDFPSGVNLVADYEKKLFELWIDVIRCLLPQYKSKTPNGERQLEGPKSIVRVSQSVQRVMGDVSASLERDVLEAISASATIPKSVVGGILSIQGVIGGTITHLCQYSENMTTQRAINQFHKRSIYGNGIGLSFKTTVLEEGLKVFDEADQNRVVSFHSRSSYGELGWSPEPYIIPPEIPPHHKPRIILFCSFLETLLLPNFLYSFLGIGALMDCCLKYCYELVIFWTVIQTVLGLERQRQAKLKLEIMPAGNVQVFLGHNGIVGIAPEYAQPGDMICHFLNCDVAAVIRRHGDRYRFVGRALVFKGASSMRLNEWTAKNFKYVVPMGDDLFHQSRRISFHVDFATLQLLTK